MFQNWIVGMVVHSVNVQKSLDCMLSIFWSPYTSPKFIIYFFLIFNPHLRICLLILERKRQGERERERNRDVWENSNRLPSVCALTWDQTRKILVHRMTFRPTEPPGQGWIDCMLITSDLWYVNGTLIKQYFLKDFYLFTFKERGREGGRRGEKQWRVRETPISCLPPARLQPGSQPTTQASAQTENRTGDPLVCRLVPNPLSHTGQA